jgi:hypothetical protein
MTRLVATIDLEKSQQVYKLRPSSTIEIFMSCSVKGLEYRQQKYVCVCVYPNLPKQIPLEPYLLFTLQQRNATNFNSNMIFNLYFAMPNSSKSQLPVCFLQSTILIIKIQLS